jgi:alpha-L-rhamnosidase
LGITESSMTKLFAVATLLAVALYAPLQSPPSDLMVDDLRCEYATDPMGIDVRAPRLFWKLKSDAGGARQTAYQILASSSLEPLSRDEGDQWDSGRVRSDETTHIPYGGKALVSTQRVLWKVRVWDGAGRASAWSAVASWTMGLLDTADWSARWISDPADSESPLLRREFPVKAGLSRATIHVSGLGQYELFMNGTKVGDDVLSPGWTKYDKTVLYDTRDVTPLVRPGVNAVGMVLGKGMYRVDGGRYTKFKGSFGALMAIAQLHLEYEDGTRAVIATDEHWRSTAGPVTFSCVYGGEDYDARKAPRGWSAAGFDDATWRHVAVISGPGGVLKGFTSAAPPLGKFETLQPVRVTRLSDRVSVYDLGQNVSLMAQVSVHGPAGSSVTITPAELLKQDGSVDRQSAGGGKSYWKYTLAGGQQETWFPQFFYHGARYLQVERAAADGPGALPTMDSLVGIVVHSTAPAIGTFESSDDLFNRIHTLIRWAQRSNLVSVITDCPHRERLGWLEQYHLNGPSLRYEFDLARLFEKGMGDMADSQLPTGLVPDIAPEYTVFEEGFRDSPEWGSAYVIVPWQQYEWTGDTELLRRHYDGMKRYVAYLGARATNHIVSHGLGDWYDIGPGDPGKAQLTPIALTATGFYYYDTVILSRVAALLGNTEDARRFSEQAEQIRNAFNAAFFDSAAQRYATGSQTANALPLVMGLVDPSNRAAAGNAIVTDVKKRGNALTAGDVGYRYLLRALADSGRSDVIFDMNHQSEKPGYGYQLARGATSLTEAWNADERSSQNHFMLGHLVEWLYHDLAGIGIDPSAPGFKRIRFSPQPVGGISWVKASLDTIRGRVTTQWTRRDGGFTLEILVPPNTTAAVSVPVREGAQVMVDAPTGGPAAQQVGKESGRVVFAVASGKWRFTSACCAE